MLDTITQMFRKPTALEMASQELADAELQVLASHSMAEYASSMVTYHQARINRLKSVIQQQTTQHIQLTRTDSGYFTDIPR